MNTTKLTHLFRGVSREELKAASTDAARALLGLHGADADTQAFACRQLGNGSTVDASIPPLVTRVMVACVQSTDAEALPADRLVAAGHLAISGFQA